MSGAWTDVRYGLRLLRTTPGFTVVAVLTLALGIGANTAIFSVVHGILLQPLPLPDADRLVVLCETHSSVADFCVASPPDVEDWSVQSRTLASVGIGRDWSFTLKAEGGPQGLDGGIVTPGYFDSLGVTAALGRLFDREDLEPGRRQVVVLSHELWTTRFGSDPEIVGRVLPFGSGTRRRRTPTPAPWSGSDWAAGPIPGTRRTVAGVASLRSGVSPKAPRSDRPPKKCRSSPAGSRRSTRRRMRGVRRRRLREHAVAGVRGTRLTAPSRSSC